MKQFLLGLLAGGLCGGAASLIKDKNGQRVGEPLKENLLAAAKEARKLKGSLHRARQAATKLKQTLPGAQRSLRDMQQEVNNFKIHNHSRLSQIERQAQQLRQKTGKEAKKD